MDRSPTKVKNDMRKILFSNPKTSISKKKNKIFNSIRSVINSGIYIKGNQTELFENRFKKYLNAKYCIGTGNATDSIYLALKAIGIKKNDEVLTTSLTATATGLAIKNAGAKIKFLEICEKSFCINLKNLEKFISKKTKAIVYVHLYGQSGDVGYLKKICNKKGIYLIEDCAQSAGGSFKDKKLGTYGDISCFSFFPTKNLPCVGDGGAIVTNNLKFYNIIKSMSQYGWDKKRNSIYQGINSRLDEIQSSILNVNLNELDKMNKERRKIAKRYLKNIKNHKILLPQNVKGSYHVYHLFVIRVKNRQKLFRILEEQNIFCGIHYKLPVHKQKIFKTKNKLRLTEKISSEIVSLPMYPGLKQKDQDRVIKILNNF